MVHLLISLMSTIIEFQDDWLLRGFFFHLKSQWNRNTIYVQFSSWYFNSTFPLKEKQTNTMSNENFSFISGFGPKSNEKK